MLSNPTVNILSLADIRIAKPVGKDVDVTGHVNIKFGRAWLPGQDSNLE